MLFGRVRLMLNRENFIDCWRCILWTEAASNVTLIENVVVKTIAKNAETFIVTKQEKLWAKLEDCAIPCKWLACTNSHANGSYHVLNSKTRQAKLTPDTVYIKKSNFH